MRIYDPPTNTTLYTNMPTFNSKNWTGYNCTYSADKTKITMMLWDFESSGNKEIEIEYYS